MQINSIIMAGRLVDDVDYKSTKNGTPLSTFRLANNRGENTNYFHVASFGKVADYAHKYLKKSERVTVQGKLEHQERKNDDGSYSDYYTIVADTFDPIHRKAQSKTDRNLYVKVDALNKKLKEISKSVATEK